MKAWLFILLWCVMALGYSKELNSFQEIYDSVEEGNKIKFIIHLDACVMKTPVSTLTAFISPRAILLRQTYLTFSHSPMTTRNPNFMDQPIIENVTYKLTHESLHMTIKFLSLPNYNVVGETRAVCPLSKAVRVFS